MIDRTKIPKPSKNTSFEIPEIKNFRTQKENEIYFIRKDKLPIINLAVLLFTGSKNDPTDKKGLALLTSFLIDEGAANYDAFQISNEFEKLGTIFSISVNHDTFSFSILSLKENFERSLELVSIILNEPKLKEEDFLREKKKLLDKILQLKDEPSYIASAAFDKQIFLDSYYSHPTVGYEQTVKNITLEDIKDYYQKYLKNNRKKFLVVGNTSEEEISNLVDKYFSNNNQTTLSPELILPEKSNTKFYLVHKENSPQSEIRIGHIAKKRNSPDYFHTKIVNSILGGEFFSRINLNLRERRGITYGAHSSFLYYQNAGYFEVSTAVNIENTAEAITEVFKELNNIKQNITDEEIQLAKSYSINHFPAYFESYNQLIHNIALLIIHELPLNYFEDYIKNIEEVSKEDIYIAAKNNIHTDKLTVVIVGDKNKILPQIKTITEKIIELDLEGHQINIL
ncbi:MAG: insulinase family protein [Melioribacter sp.]|nr:insulinase family protein [Melioribacter sp.]